MENLQAFERMARVTEEEIGDKIEALLSRHRAPLTLSDILSSIMPHAKDREAITGPFWKWWSRLSDVVRSVLLNDARFEVVEHHVSPRSFGGGFDQVVLYALRQKSDPAPEWIGEIAYE